MSTTDSSDNSISQYVATLLDDLITWRIVGNKTPDVRGLSNIQPHGGAWMPAKSSFDRMLFWRTVENNGFQLVEYSMSRNLVHNAIQLNFASPTNVLPNVFIVELIDRDEICLMFATHAGVYRWILKHPLSSNSAQSEQSESILADINDGYLNDRSCFYRYDLQLYGEVRCAFTIDHLIYAFHNQMETLILRFDNENFQNAPQQLTFPKRQSTGLFNFLWNPNKSISSNQSSQPLIAGQTTIICGALPMTILLYDNGLLRFLSDQIDTVLHEYNLSNDLTQSFSKVSRKMFLDYCQYVTFSNELVTRLFIVLDGNDLLHLLIYEFQYDRNNQFLFSLYQNKSYSKMLHLNDHSHLPHGSSLTSLTCTNDRLLLQFLTNQNRSLLFLVQYEFKTNHGEQFLLLPMDKHRKSFNDDSTSIDHIEGQLNSPGEFTMDMIKNALWITFNLNLDEYNQSWTSATQILQQLPSILQSLCNDHCDEQSIRNDDRFQVLTKFWQNFYSTLIDLRAQALVLLGCRMFDERQLIIIIHKSAISFYSTSKGPTTFNPRYSRFINDIEYLLETSDDDKIDRIDDALFNENSTNELQQIICIQKNLEPIVNNDHLIETLQTMYDKSSNNKSVKSKDISIWTSKMARRLLTLLFVQMCNEKTEQIQRLNKIIPLIFRANDHQSRILSHRMERIQEKVLPYLQELLQIYQVLSWISSCAVELSSNSMDDRNLFIEHLLNHQSDQQQRHRLGNQSLIEQILIDHIPTDISPLNSENWFQMLTQTAENLISDLWPSRDFLLIYLSSRHQWSILDQYCSKLSWLKQLNSSRQFFHALAFYRSGNNIETATRYLAAVFKELRSDPLLIKLFGQQTNPEMSYIEWIRDYLKYFGRNQHIAAFLHQSLPSSDSNEIRALIVKALFETSLDLKNFDDAYWCIQNTNDYLSQKQYTFEYASSICSLPLDQSIYRLQTLFQYQCDKLGHIDLELLAYIERTCVEQQPMKKSQVYALYELYRTIQFPLKMAQLMYHYGCSINDLREQKEALQLAFNALELISADLDATNRLFIYPINQEYHFISPLHSDHHNVRLIGLEECRQKLAVISAIHKLKNDQVSSNIQATDNMHPTQLSGLLTKFHHFDEAQKLLEAFRLNKSVMPLIH